MRPSVIFFLCVMFILLTGMILPTSMNIPVLPGTPYDYSSLNLPAHFTGNAPNSPLPTSINGLDNTPSDNPITDHGATLGRVLFYDKMLSANGSISCASCHQAVNGFSDPATLSIGFDGGTTGRHSMTLINARWYQRGRFFWDERATTLEEQVLMPFQDPVEMGLTLTQLENIVSSQSYYSDLFINAFGDSNVTSERIAKALAQFVRSIVSFNSEYDLGRSQVANPGQNFPNFTTEENLGKQLFFQTIPNGGGACFGCHTTEAFVSANPGPQNNGLDATTTDPGAGTTFQNNPIFDGRFKTSTLRNIELTVPYMHDGRFATLEEVIEHYNSGIQAHPTLSPALTDANGDPVQLNFTNDEKAALVAFLKTLTDPSIANEEKWSDPFSTVLPVVLVDFMSSKEDDGILLQWVTSSEINNESFYVEKSEDGLSWNEVANILGAGISSIETEYSFLDNDPIDGIQYYRLRQVDYDGSISYSKVISEIWERSNISFSIYPNPASELLVIETSEPWTDRELQFKILNIEGRAIIADVDINQQSQPIDIATFRPGIYILQLYDQKELIHTIKFNKL